jgi:hypothetical protein
MGDVECDIIRCILSGVGIGHWWSNYNLDIWQGGAKEVITICYVKVCYCG